MWWGVRAMRLIKLKLEKFRRFADVNSLDLNEDLIALVGPNEAGKSSILDALDLVGKGMAPIPSDTTRGLTGQATLSVLHVLDPDDKALLAGIHDGDKVTHLWVQLITGEDRPTWQPDPRPFRDLRPRQRCRGLIEALEGDPALDAVYSTNEDWGWDPQLYVDANAILTSDDETLTDEAISSLESLGQRLRALSFPGSSEAEGEPDVDPEVAIAIAERSEAREAAASALVDLAQIERRPLPVEEVNAALSGRTPDVAFFRAEDRELQSTYQLSDVADDPPSALQNLCVLADLDLAAVQNDITLGRAGHVEAIFEDANLRLRDRFRATWRQSDVYPRLTTPLDGVLRILVSVEGGGNYSIPEERSDGLRWFMALHAFLAARGKSEPILLVDEAETHLHYDAQADLVDALMSQKIARQVIYTTHSVGCLPPDLGCGIRVMLAKKDAERSHIANSYWSVDPDDNSKVGYTPLLFAMGARLLSLTIPRFGVIAEGPSDAVLLPSLFREATGNSRLPYRVVPGLSDVADSDVSSLSQEGGQIVALADGDGGGREICRKLSHGGMDPATIFSLGDVLPGCTLEDLVDPAILADAINLELETWNIGPFRVTAAELPATERWAWLVQKGVETGTAIERLSKPRVAQRVVDLGRTSEPPAARRRSLDPDLAPGLLALHERLCAALDTQSL